MVITRREMLALDVNAEYFGVSGLQLMENAGKGVADEIAARFEPEKTKVAILCGLGRNGGDGFVAARHLTCLGFKVTVVLAGKSSGILSKESRRNWWALRAMKDDVELHEVSDSAAIPRLRAEVVVDALLGIGVDGRLRPPISQMVKKINKSQAFRVSVDVPTGIHADSGEVLGRAVRADLTVTFHRMKPGLLNAEAYAGTVKVKSIGLPSGFERFAGPGDVSLVVKPRSSEAHKGDFGKLLVVGGSEVFSGAPALVALAALRTGVDLTYVAAPEKAANAIAAMSPSLITVKLKGSHLHPPNTSVLKGYLQTSTAVVMGPGLGVHEETKLAVKETMKLVGEAHLPLLLDADGLKAFAEFQEDRIECIPRPLVLTPHAGEYEILTGRALAKDLNQRVSDVQRTAQTLGTTILLKGPVDVISNGKRVKLNFTGNPGMTVGGTGDVLSGIVGALLAQGANSFDAAVAGAFISGASGDFVRYKKGYHMVPTDIIEWIPRVMENPMSHLKVRKGARQRGHDYRLSRQSV